MFVNIGMQKCVSFDDDADNDAEAGGVPDNDEAPPVNRPRIPSVNKGITDDYDLWMQILWQLCDNYVLNTTSNISLLNA